jgi:hypothetical protein
MLIGSWQEAAQFHLVLVVLEDKLLLHQDQRMEEHLGK